MVVESVEVNVSSGLRVLGLGAAKGMTFDFSKSRLITEVGTSLSSATMTADTGTTNITIGSVTCSSNKATATFTTVAAGTTLVKCVGTFANGATDVMVGQVVVVNTLDPSTWTAAEISS